MMPNNKAVPTFVDDALSEDGANADVHNDQAAMAKIAVARGRAEVSAKPLPSSPASGEEEDKKKAPKKGTGIADIDELIDFEKMQFTFPERLFDLLKGGTVERALQWLPGGDAFSVVPDIFYDVVLLSHFQGTKFESFTRKLNRWGFKRLTGKSVPQDCIAYYHPLFRKDHPELLKMMRSGRNKFFVPADMGGIAARRAPHPPGGLASEGNQRLDFAGACKMGPVAPSALQPGLFRNPAAHLAMPWHMGAASAGAGLSQQPGNNGQLNERVLDEMLRYQALQSSQQLFPGNLAGLAASSQQQQQQQRLDNSLSSFGNNATLSLRQLLAAEQQHKAASQVSNDSRLAGSPFARSQVSPHLGAQQILANQRATANEADLRLSQLLAQSAAGSAPSSGAAAQTRNTSKSLYDTLSSLGLPQGQSTSDVAAVSAGNLDTANTTTATDAQFLRLLLLQEQMERNNRGHFS